MGGIVRFVFALIWIALALGATGQLIDATLNAKAKAEETYRTKGVSAKWWNQKLIE